jgi:hypothetical protein
MAKVLYQFRGAERDHIERMYRDLVALQGAFTALVNAAAAREKVPEGSTFDPNQMRFVPREG